MEKLRSVRLYGFLGARFGRVHRLAVSSPAEAIRALCVLFPGLQRTLAESKSKGIAYAVFVGRNNLGETELGLPPGAEDIRIAPMIQGAKRAGLFQLVLGAALVTAGYFTFGATSQIGISMMMAGASMALGGVVQLLSPQQVGLSAKDSPDNGASYNFNGPVNTQAQGNPVGVLYGEMTVGSAVISAGIYAEDQT